jgi:sulfoxide reductase heme-binding subunit YedZ
MELLHTFGKMFPLWDTTRALGLTAYLLLFVSVVAGLLQSLKVLPSRVIIYVSVLHTFTAWLGLLFSITHGLILIYDTYVGYTIMEIFIPFAAKKDSFEIALGILSFYIILVIMLSCDLLWPKKGKRWRILHYLSYPAFVFALYHGVAIGTDTVLPGMKLFYFFTGTIVSLLLVVRILKKNNVQVENK